MTPRGRFFQKAEVDSDWPFRFLTVFFGIVLAVFEGSLALWPFFYGATPMLSLIFLYWVALHHEKYVFLATGFLIGLASDLLFSDLVGGRATAYIAVVFLMELRRARLLHGEFRELWIEFTAVCVGVTLFQLMVFSALNLAIPALTPVLFQVGVTMILFPIGYVTMMTMNMAFNRIKASS